MANAVDREFVRLTIPHHHQGVQMATLAAERGSMPELKRMAEEMADDQRKEIAELEQLLPSVGLSDGDVQPEKSKAVAMERLLEHLGQLSGQQFDQSFLALMTNHHLGAIQMSEVQIAGGELDQVKELARNSHDKQMSEAGEMSEMLSGMSGGQGMMNKVKDALP